MAGQGVFLSARGLLRLEAVSTTAVDVARVAK
jgi:hypothetical protein